MEEYVENYQTAVDTQSGQSWQRMNENLQKSFSSLTDMAIASDKARADRLVKNYQESQKWIANEQADYLAYTSDVSKDKILGKVEDPDFKSMMNGAAELNAKYKGINNQSKILTPNEKEVYTNTTLLPTKTKELVEGVTNIGITRKEMGEKGVSGGGWSAVNNGTKIDEWTKLSTPKPGEKVQVKFEATDDKYSSVKAVLYINDKKAKFGDEDLELSLEEIKRWTNPDSDGEDGAIPIVNAPIYIDASKAGAIDTMRNTPIFISKETLKPGQPSTMVGTPDPMYLDKSKPIKIPNKADGTYTLSYKLNTKGLEAIESSAKKQVAEMSLSKKISWMVDNLGHDKSEYSIDKLKEASVIAGIEETIKADIVKKLNVPQPEMDEIGSGQVIHKDKELESGPTDPNNPNKNIALSGKQSGKYIGIKLDPARATALRKQASKIIKDVGGTMQVRYYNADTQNINTLKLKYNADNGGLVDEDGNNITRADLEALIGIK